MYSLNAVKPPLTGEKCSVFTLLFLCMTCCCVSKVFSPTHQTCLRERRRSAAFQHAHLLFPVKCQKVIGAQQGTAMTECQQTGGHMTAERSNSEDDHHLLQTNTLKPAAPSLKELERAMDSCRMELNEVDEVWPNLYVGGIVIAHNKEELKRHGITHILNAAHNAWGSKGNQAFYGKEFYYHGIAAEDSIDFDLSIYFHPASEYIHKALSAPNGKILTHCILGKSRSAALVLAYLMIYHHFSLAAAVERVLQSRAISPNRGFLKQLQDLELELRHKISSCQLL